MKHQIHSTLDLSTDTVDFETFWPGGDVFLQKSDIITCACCGVIIRISEPFCSIMSLWCLSSVTSLSLSHDNIIGDSCYCNFGLKSIKRWDAGGEMRRIYLVLSLIFVH